MRGLLASVAGAQPGVEYRDRIIEAVRVADGDERLTAVDRVGTGESIEGGDGKLRLRERQSRLVARPGMPPGSRRVEPPRLLVEREEEECKRVGKRHLRELGGERPSYQQVSPVESATELAVRAPVRGELSGPVKRLILAVAGAGGAAAAVPAPPPNRIRALTG